MRNIILLTIIGLTFISCSKENDDTRSELIGKWTWITSSGGLAGTTETPQSTGKIRTLEISADSIKSFSNGTLYFKTAYTIETLESQIFNEPREMVIQENGLRQIIELKAAKLILIGDCFDCYTSEYIKE